VEAQALDVIDEIVSSRHSGEEIAHALGPAIARGEVGV